MNLANENADKFIQENIEKVRTQYKPNYHFSAPIGWINDPNGFVYFKDEYHLFYQHYPYDSVWGPMHWGHAKSKDLIHWEHLPIALAPERTYDLDGCFSGSAIEKDGKLYVMYTGHYERDGVKRETQCIAYSEDGIHFEKYKKNPVIDERHIEGVADITDFRDPKLFERNGKYYAVVASKTVDERGRILLFESLDLLEWTFTSILLEGDNTQGVMWECPDLFHLDGKDVLIMSPIQIREEKYQYKNTSSTTAFIGKVDWSIGTFQVENTHEIDFGLDFYAPQTCEDNKQRRIMIAWMQMWHRNMPSNDLKHGWAGAMTLPRELYIQENRLSQKPVIEFIQALQPIKTEQNIILKNQTIIVENSFIEQGLIHIQVDLKEANQFSIQLGGNEEYLLIHYDAVEKELTLDRSRSGHDIVGAEEKPLRKRTTVLKLNMDLLDLQIVIDTTSIEIFANDQVTMTSTFYKKKDERHMLLISKGNALLKTLEVSKI